MKKLQVFQLVVFHLHNIRDSVDFLGISEKHEMLLNLFVKHNENVRLQIDKGKSKTTYQKYERTRKHLEDYLKRQYKLSDIAIREINSLFITDFEVYLRTVGKCNYNTTAKFMQFFKRIILIAQNNGWLLHDPFANYKITLKKVDRDYLTDAELEKIANRKFATKRLELVRDIFLFACYTGLAYIDVKELTKDNIRISFDGEEWIMRKRVKTAIQSNIPLLIIPKAIIEKYEGETDGNRLLPILSNQKMNSYLKEIADLCGINKNLTFHQGRHTNYSSQL